MKFSYDKTEDNREVVAELFHMEGSPKDICLNLYGTQDDTVITMYYDGHVTAQKPFTLGDCSIQRFYKGDKITIEL